MDTNKENDFQQNTTWFDYCENFKDGFAIIIKNHKYNFINREGKIISNTWFDYCENFYEGFARVRKDGKWNLINREGKLISENY